MCKIRFSTSLYYYIKEVVISVGTHSAMEHYSGHRYLRGHGLGNIFSQLFRSGVPFLKKVGSYLGEKLFNMGANTLSEVRKGRKFKDALKSQAKKSKEEVLGDVKSKIKKKMFGGGKRRVLLGRRVGAPKNVRRMIKRKRRSTKKKGKLLVKRGHRGVKRKRKSNSNKCSASGSKKGKITLF